MSMNAKGDLILLAVETETARNSVLSLLRRSAPRASRQSLVDLLSRLPRVISRNVEVEQARKMIAALESLGAEAEFRPASRPSVTARRPPVASSSKPATVPPAKSPKPIPAVGQRSIGRKRRQPVLNRIADMNREIWLILSMMLILVALNYLITAKYVLLSLYTLPTLFSAYFFGRRHATLTAFFCLLLVLIALQLNPALMAAETSDLYWVQWYDVVAWGAILMVTGYAMGTLYERNQTRLNELRRTYHGLIVILRHFMSKDQYTENHCYRVSIYAAKIAGCMGFDSERIEDIRSAALLHDLGKLDLSRDLLHKAAGFDSFESSQMKAHVDKGVQMLGPVQTPLNRILPIILAHHEKYDGTGYYGKAMEEIPLESMVLKVADVYDALVSDRPYRKAMAPLDAKAVITKGSGREFHPRVVAAFLKAYETNQLEVPHLIV